MEILTTHGRDDVCFKGKECYIYLNDFVSSMIIPGYETYWVKESFKI